jgi:hypothetical protein
LTRSPKAIIGGYGVKAPANLKEVAMYQADSVYTDDFPACCGARVLSEFPNDEDFEANPEYPDERCTKKATIQRIKESLEKGYLFTATTCPYQKKAAECLAECGFKPVAKWKNKNTGSLLTLWVWGQQKSGVKLPPRKARLPERAYMR